MSVEVPRHDDVPGIPLTAGGPALAEIERTLARDDPALARHLATLTRPRRRRRTAAVAIALGAVALILSMHTASAALFVAAIAATLLGWSLLLTSRPPQF